MGEHTTLTKATSRGNSLRTTVPSGIVKQFNLREKDILDWNLEVKDGKLVLIVRPIKQERFTVAKKKKKKKPVHRELTLM